jgi:hypothetical protein
METRPSIHTLRGIHWRERIDNIALALEGQNKPTLDRINTMITTHQKEHKCAIPEKCHNFSPEEHLDFSNGLNEQIGQTLRCNDNLRKNTILRLCVDLARLAIVTHTNLEIESFEALLAEVEALANGRPNTAKMNAASELTVRQQPKADLSAIEVTIPPPPAKKGRCYLLCCFNATVQNRT